MANVEYKKCKRGATSYEFAAEVLKVEMTEGSKWLSTGLLALFRQFDSCALYKYRNARNWVLELRRSLHCSFQTARKNEVWKLSPGALQWAHRNTAVPTVSFTGGLETIQLHEVNFIVTVNWFEMQSTFSSVLTYPAPSVNWGNFAKLILCILIALEFY